MKNRCTVAVGSRKFYYSLCGAFARAIAHAEDTLRTRRTSSGHLDLKRHQARSRRQPPAPDLHRRARGPARVDEVLGAEGAHPARGRVRGEPLARLGPARGWPSSASSASASPRSTAARAATTTTRWSAPRPSPTPAPAASTWASRSTPTWSLPPIELLGTEDQKQRYLVPGIKGEKIASLGITEPGAGSDVAGIRTTARKRDGDEYVINGSKTFITNGAARRLHPAGGQDRPGRRATTASRCSSSTSRTRTATRPGLHGLPDAREDGHARLRHGRALLRGRPRPGGEPARPGGQGLLPHLLGAPGRAPRRRGRLRRGRRAGLREDARVRQGARGLRPPDRQVPGDPAQVRRDGRRRSRPPSSSPTRPPGASPTASTRSARSPRRSSTPRGSPARSPTSASRSTAATAT